MRYRAAIAASVAATALSGTAQADLLDLELLDFPDIFSSFIQVDYNATTDVFTAAGFATSFDDDGVGNALPVTGARNFDLNATIDALGMAVDGTLVIEGDIEGFGGPDLLQGALLDFGFIDGGGEILEFLFSVTGGDLSDEYGGIGAEFGVILDINDPDGYSGDWTQDYSGTGLGVSDTAPIVPGPAGLALLGLAAVGRRRRRG